MFQFFCFWSGSVFEGEFSLGERHGFGVLTDRDGKRQVGCGVGQMGEWEAGGGVASSSLLR